MTKYHVKNTDDEYQIVSNETGDVNITVSKRLKNAWFIVQTCMSLLLINKPEKPKTLVV